MEWSIGHSLIVVVAVLLGLAAGWLLRGRQGAGATRPIVDGDPVAGLAVVSNPEPPATTDEARPAATIDPAPVAVADEPTPVDTVSAPATVTASDDPAPNAVDPGDMALTETPPAVAPVERTDAVDEPERVDEQPAPATVVAPRQPLDDSTSASDEPTAADPIEAAPADTTPADTTPAEQADTDPTATDATPAEAVPVEAVPTAPVEQADAVTAGSAYTGTTPADTTPAVAAGLADVDEAEPARATPPVRAADAPPIPAATDPTGPADDFRRIQGVGPKMAAALQAAGVRTYRQLGELDEPALRDLIRAAGLRAAPALATWPQQARVLAGAGDEASAVLPGGDQG
ncbi:hypothetical protein [Micromonospora sp. WMMD736]|uniref:hypothetical protein n=1 Tax=Micromonospora sp. WMMD736 TaxID=3404112 RepID=UPI003B93B206